MGFFSVPEGVPHEAWRAWFGQLAQASPSVFRPTLRLYSALAGGGGYNAVVGDFTEATFLGYAPSSGSHFYSADTVAGRGQLVHWSDEFDSDPSIVTPETILGFYITNAAGTSLLGYCPFDEPIVMAHPNDTLALEVGILDDGSAFALSLFIGSHS